MLAEDIQNYIEAVAKDRNTEVSATIKGFLDGASALNYMNQKGPFEVTRAMLDDPKYFDNLFTDWHERLMKIE